MSTVEAPGLRLPSPLMELHDDRLSAAGVRMLLKRRVYVAKMMFGLFDQIQQHRFPPGTTVVAVITGPDFTTEG